MSDFTRLTSEEQAHLDRYEAYRRHRTRFLLRGHVERSAVRVADAVRPHLDPEDPEEGALLARLQHRVGDAYDRLRHLAGAERFARWVAAQAFARTGLERGT